MISIQVYLDDGRVFVYSVADAAKAREHSHAIVTTGYRHVQPPYGLPLQDGYLEHYPPHRILKVKCVGDGVATMYSDTVRGT